MPNPFGMSDEDLRDVIDTAIAEAGGEPLEGQIATLYTIVNRAREQGVSPGAIVRQRAQFEGYSNPGPGSRRSQRDPEIRARTEALLRQVEEGAVPDPMRGGTMFHASSITPYWADEENRYGTRTIGNQTYYLGNNAALSAIDALSPPDPAGAAPAAAREAYAASMPALPRDRPAAPPPDPGARNMTRPGAFDSVFDAVAAATDPRLSAALNPGAPPSLASLYAGGGPTRPPTDQVGIAPTGRPMLSNPDGSVSTELSITVTDPRINGGRPTNVPTIWGGRRMNDDMAVNAALASGQKFPAFPSIPAAERAAEYRSENEILRPSVPGGALAGQEATGPRLVAPQPAPIDDRVTARNAALAPLPSPPRVDPRSPLEREWASTSFARRPATAPQVVATPPAEALRTAANRAALSIGANQSFAGQEAAPRAVAASTMAPNPLVAAATKAQASAAARPAPPLPSLPSASQPPKAQDRLVTAGLPPANFGAAEVFGLPRARPEPPELPTAVATQLATMPDVSLPRLRPQLPTAVAVAPNLARQTPVAGAARRPTVNVTVNGVGRTAMPALPILVQRGGFLFQPTSQGLVSVARAPAGSVFRGPSHDPITNWRESSVGSRVDAGIDRPMSTSQ